MGNVEKEEDMSGVEISTICDVVVLSGEIFSVVNAGSVTSVVEMASVLLSDTVVSPIVECCVEIDTKEDSVVKSGTKLDSSEGLDVSVGKINDSVVVWSASVGEVLSESKLEVVSDDGEEDKVVGSVSRTSVVEIWWGMVDESSGTAVDGKVAVVENSSSDVEKSVVGPKVVVGSLVRCESVVNGNSGFISSKISVVGTFGPKVEEATVSVVSDSVTISPKISSDVAVEIASVAESVEC